MNNKDNSKWLIIPVLFFCLSSCPNIVRLNDLFTPTEKVEVFIAVSLTILIAAFLAFQMSRLTKRKTPNLKIKEETATKLILEIKATKTVFTVDVDLGVITRAKLKWGKAVNQAQLSVYQVDKIVEAFEDTPTGLIDLARGSLTLITTQGQEFEVVREDKALDISPIAKKIAQLLHKNIEYRGFAYGTWKQAG